VNGLVGSVPEQYFRWLGHFVTGHWGTSIKGSRPVWPAMRDAMGNTLVLGTVAWIVGMTVGVAVGMIAALRPHSRYDRITTTGAFVGVSILPFISAVLLQLLFAVYLTRWLGRSEPFLPTSGVYPPGHQGFDLALRAKHLVLPVTVLAIQSIALYSRYARTSLLEVMGSDHLRTARSKGISERRVVLRHGLRNAMTPIVTLAALEVGSIVGGLIVTERIFAYRGMGDYFLTAWTNGDYPQLMPWLVITVVSVVVFNLVADVLYAVLDPRARLA
jgi:peptide/nickel transport system permease protein